MSPGRFSVIYGSRPYLVGGIVADIFRDLQMPTTFAGGGGVVAHLFFRYLQVKINQIPSIPRNF